MVAKVLQDVANVVHEGDLVKAVHYLFGGENITSNARRNASLKNPNTGFFFELDVYIPNLNIAFEFQDIHHYMTTWYYHLPVPTIKERDFAKVETAQQAGVTLIQVPCWWDANWESLASTIHFYRPDLLVGQTTKHIISLNPNDFFKGGLIPGIGELMHASFSTSPSLDQIVVNNSWWLGEKYDGVRCFWNFGTNILYSRSGVPIDLPSTVSEDMPPLLLDCEIWFGRGSFLETQKIINFDPEFIYWPDMRIIAFDAPKERELKEAFEMRYERALTAVDLHHPFLGVAMRMGNLHSRHVTQMLRHVINDDGEGVILRKAGSAYEQGRSTSLLKFKASRADREALVIDVGEQDVLVKLPSGVTFWSSLDSFKFRPKNGDVVSFSYEQYSKKEIPIQPVFYRIRTDVSWNDVVRDYVITSAQQGNKKEDSAIEEKKNTSWSPEKVNMRNFLEKFAKSKGMDPLIADNWYSLSRTSMIVENKGMGTISKQYKGGIVKMLRDLFPEIGIDEKKFNLLPANYWADLKNRKEFFENFAEQEGFSPLVPENWYSLPKENLKLSKGYLTLFSMYNNRYHEALIHVFPDIGLDRQKFFSNAYWPDSAVRKELFIQFAILNSFDPFIAANWYRWTIDDFMEMKGAYQVFHFYRNNFPRALSLLFPEIGIDLTLFIFDTMYQKKENRRQFFENFADRKGFQITNVERWYQTTIEDLLSEKNARLILGYYSWKIDKAIMDLFPSLNLSSHNFIHNKFWGDRQNQAHFLKDIAVKNHFDPFVADNWYSLDIENILKVPGGYSVLSFYNGNIAYALKNVFPQVSFDLHKFSPRRHKYWVDKENQKQFFIEIAKDQGFDPLIARNWYSITVRKILNYKGAGCILSYYEGNFINSLIQLFPNIGLSRDKFSSSLEERQKPKKAPRSTLRRSNLRSSL